MSSQPPRRRSSRPYMPWDFFRRDAQRAAPRSSPRPQPPTAPQSRQPAASPFTTPPAGNDPNRGYPPASPGGQGFNRPPVPGRPVPHTPPPQPSAGPGYGRPRPPAPTYDRSRSYPPQARPPRQYFPAPRRGLPCSLSGCLFSLLILLTLGVISAAYLLWPGRTNILLLGIDYADWWNWQSRTDTIMLTTWIPAEKYVGILSVPRDLWVNIAGVGENRINTAHFFCEINQPGSGPQCTAQTIQANFGVTFKYYVRVRFEGFKDVVNALGGVDITLTEPMAGYEPGEYHLTGNKALAFVRARYDSDDFHRMEHGQFMLKAVVKTMLQPKNWFKLPAVIRAVLRNVDTDLPTWLWPRYAFTLLRAGVDGIDNRVIKAEMVTPFYTNEGAAVLAPNWDLILPVVNEMFLER